MEGRAEVMRRTPLKRSRFMRSSRKSKYRRRERFTDYMLFVKTLTCSALAIDPDYPCGGPVEADHAGERGLGQKAHDSTVIPLCSAHHRQRTDFSGAFRTWNQEQMRKWLAQRIYLTQRMASGKGVIVPRIEESRP